MSRATAFNGVVVRADGLVVPGNYALPARWALGSLNEDRLPTLARTWRKEGLRRWRALVDATLAGLPAENMLVNFGARLLTTAHLFPAKHLDRHGDEYREQERQHRNVAEMAAPPLAVPHAPQ